MTIMELTGWDHGEGHLTRFLGCSPELPGRTVIGVQQVCEEVVMSVLSEFDAIGGRGSKEEQQVCRRIIKLRIP